MMRQEIDALIRSLTDAAQRCEALAERAHAEATVKPDFTHTFGAAPEIRVGRLIGGLLDAASHAARAARRLRDVKGEL